MKKIYAFVAIMGLAFLFLNSGVFAQGKIEILNDKVELKVGETEQLEAVYYDENGDEVEVEFSWCLCPPYLGSIDETELFTAKGRGNGQIYVRFEDLVASVKVEVSDENGDDESEWPRIEIKNEPIELKVGETEQLEAVYYDENGDEGEAEFEWGLCPSNLGDIDDVNLFTAEAAGKGCIYVRFGELIASVEVEVDNDDDGSDEFPRIEVSPDEIELKVEETEQLEAVYYDENGDEAVVEFLWYVVPSYLGTIDATGLFTAEHPGKGHIIVQSGDLKAKVRIKVVAEDDGGDGDEQKLPRVQIVTRNVNLILGELVQLMAIYLDETGDEVEAEIVWTVEPSDLGTFSDTENGLFQSEKVGKGIIVAAVGDVSDQVSVRIVESEEDGKGGPEDPKNDVVLVIEPQNAMVEVGSFLQYSARFKKQGGIYKEAEVEWSCSGDPVGEFLGEGIFSAHTAGVALIQATSGDAAATTTIIVTDPETPDEEANTILISRVLPDGHILPPREIAEGQVYTIGGLPYPLNLLNGGQIYFPLGSLQEDITLYLLLPESADIEDESVTFVDGSLAGIRLQVVVDGFPVEPYEFDIPLNLSITFKRGLLEGLGLTPEDLGLFFVNDDGTYASDGIYYVTVDEGSNKICAKVAHFSTLVVRDKNTTPTDTDSEANETTAPETFILEQNYPNPFNPETTIDFGLREPVPVTMEIYNITGKKVKTLKSGKMGTGYYSVIWDGRDESGNQVAGGIYLCRMKAGDYQKTIRMLLLR